MTLIVGSKFFIYQCIKSPSNYSSNLGIYTEMLHRFEINNGCSLRKGRRSICDHTSRYIRYWSVEHALSFEELGVHIAGRENMKYMREINKRKETEREANKKNKRRILGVLKRRW